MKKRTKKAIIQTAGVVLAICAVFAVLSLANYEKSPQEKQSNRPHISKDVLDYRPLVEKYAETYHVEDYVDVLLAMMMQESGGKGDDPMQSSESYCGEIGCIDDPEESIEQGVYYFSRNMEEADGDLELAVQSYNFGMGFINYAEQHDGAYSQEVAIDFSRKMYQEDRSTYTCLREEAQEHDACYGDIYYLRDVMAYRDAVKNS